MEFGKVAASELDNIDFALPQDTAVTEAVLKKGKGNTQFHIGCAKWGRKDWVGKLYPPGTKEKDFLKHYAAYFNCIEFNGFYYRQHTKETVRKWRDAVPDNFLFCPKFTQAITHLKRLKNAEAELDIYLDTATEFGKKLDPIFLMPHPQISVKHLETIENFIEQLPGDIDIFLELRHEEWYQDGYHKGLQDFLIKNNRGTVITDVAGFRPFVHMQLSRPECFIRFVGNALHPTDYSRIDDWVKRIKSWMDRGLERCYFFMHQHEELHSPKLIQYFIEKLNAACGTQIKALILYDDNTLF